MDIDRISTDRDFRLGALGPLAISVWESSPKVEHAVSSVALLRRLVKEHERIFLLAVVGEGCSVPSAPVRKALSEGLRTIAESILAVASVIEGQGFQAAAQRGVITGIGIVVSRPYPLEVFDSVQRAARFLERRAGPRLPDGETSRAVGQLRANASGWAT